LRRAALPLCLCRSRQNESGQQNENRRFHFDFSVGRYSRNSDGAVKRDNKKRWSVFMVHTTSHTRRNFVSGLTAGMGLLLGGCNRTAPESAVTPATGSATDTGPA